MKKLLITALVVALSLAFASFALAEEAAESVNIGEWTLTIVTAEGEIAFTNEDAAELIPVTIEATTKNKSGEEKTSVYTGVKLSDVLALAEITEFTSLTITAADDFSAEYDSELALKDDTLVAWEKDGELMDGEQPLQMVPASGTGNQFVKSVKTITVNP